MSSESARMLWTVLVEASLRAAAAAALAALILAVTRTRAAGVRHAVWTAIVMAMLAMPLLPRAVPAVSVAALPSVDLWPAPSPDAGFAQTSGALDPAPLAARPAEPQASLAVSSAPVSTPRRAGWAAAAADLYLAGLAVSLLYMAAGWLAMTAIVRRSQPVALPDGEVVHESSLVASPLTAGVFRPRIILPASWRAWPAETLHAVVIHERAHIRRRDPLVALVARVNRGVFWFHPLAWWLERKLAAVAEFACDETASRACGAPADYARVLVDMADDVRRNGGRLAWQGIAVGGNGQLKDRIERLLAATPWPATSRGKKTLVACGCVLAVAIAAACRPATPAQALTPDPAIVARLAQETARTARDNEARRMTPEQVAAVEAAVVRHPDDRESRETLLAYYADPRRTLDPAAIIARRAHILWTIEHHPDFDATSSWSLRMYTLGDDIWVREPMRATFHANADPEGYAQAKPLWLAAMARPGASVQTLTNAARFFEMADKPLAEAAYLKAAAREPGKWSGELGRLYGLTIVGSDATWSPLVVQHVSMTDAHSAYAEQIRRKLQESTDPRVLVSAGYTLFNADGNMPEKTPPAIDFDVRAQATTYLERAVALDPNATSAAAMLAMARLREQSWPVYRSLKGVWRPTPEQVAALPEARRLDILWNLIANSFYAGEYRYYDKNDKAAARAAWQQLAIYANDALAIGPRHPDHPGAGLAMFNAHEFLGTVALWDGDVRTALAHLDAAPGVPVSEPMKSVGGATTNRLVRNLLRVGEYDAVARYYDRMAQIDLPDRQALTKAAAAIRAGRMPEWYQMDEAREAERATRRVATR